MKTWAQMIMGMNAALFLFGAVQHTGIVVGSFREPVIFPAARVETVCAVSLLIGVTVLFGNSSRNWVLAVITNLVAMAGVVLGMVALSLGRGPRTASNELYHRIMLVLIGASLLILIRWRGRPKEVGQ